MQGSRTTAVYHLRFKVPKWPLSNILYSSLSNFLWLIFLNNAIFILCKKYYKSLSKYLIFALLWTINRNNKESSDYKELQSVCCTK